MSAVLSWKYAGFIFSAYGITFAVLLAMIGWVVLTSRARKASLAKLEADGLRRAAAREAANE
ncbi:heme exporter protein CcmD [Pseudahrensia aquimaris]|uniref:Heme exporter protein D n=1 Tax=Pseudahrensia aquimaris TaxID=744461 RepID=A0ABW3FDQ1_9HYPH